LSIRVRHSLALFAGLVEEIVEARADVLILDEDVRVFNVDLPRMRASEVVQSKCIFTPLRFDFVPLSAQCDNFGI